MREPLFPCPECRHSEHDDIECMEPITETIRDDVGYGVKPTGLTRVIIVDRCKCTGSRVVA